MSNKIILEVNEINKNNNNTDNTDNTDNEIYPPFFPQHFFVKEQPKKNIVNQRQIRRNPLNYSNNRQKNNLPHNNNMFFMKKF